MFVHTVFFLILLINDCVFGQYDLSNVFPGTRMSVNDDMFVSASNSFSNFAVVMHPFRNAANGGPIRCNMRYNTTDRFVHSVAVLGIEKNSTNAENFKFVYAAERMSTKTPYVCVGSIAKSTCISRSQCTDLPGDGNQQAYFLIGVDRNGTYAYGFTTSVAFKLDIYENRLILNLTTEQIWPGAGFVPHGLDIADTWGVVSGYGYADVVKKIYTAQGCWINLATLINVKCTLLTSETTFLVPSNVESYNDLYELPVAIRGQKVVVGIHRLSSAVVLRNIGTSLNVTKVHTVSYPDASSFGRVVDWADDTSLAILIQNPYETIWSKSQIFVYDENSVASTTPLFTFPNNQQIVGLRLSKPSFARFGITIGGNMAILTDNADILIIPVSAPGYASQWINTTEQVFVFYFEPKLCIGGTYKNRTSLGSCQICPPNTQNSGRSSQPVLECTRCDNSSGNSFCPLASLANTDFEKISSYSQAVAYPETGDTTDIEDLLMKNMFQIGSNSRCLVISPLLWTLVVSGICILVLSIMVIVKACGCKKFLKYRTHIKEIFKHTDIIGEGEMWAGGLATLAIIVLVSFSYWFSVSFIRRYPIENVFEPANFACDQTIINAQFSTGLELLDIPKSEESKLIFDLLDQQTFILTVELINTGFSCDSITTQENLVSGKYVTLQPDCKQNMNDSITSITFPLPRHQTSVQLNMSGPYWIGALRLCIRGERRSEESSTLRDLDFCEVYYTTNEAIGRTIYIPITFIKDINMTHALDSADSTTYSGLWMPTFTTPPLSDEAYYVEFGNYLRYTSSLTVLEIVLDERPFYVKNIQEPIVRTAELIFHGLLFTSLCIELFAFSFLLIKLFIIPFLRWIAYLWRRCHSKKEKSFEEMQNQSTSSQTDFDPIEFVSRL